MATKNTHAAKAIIHHSIHHNYFQYVLLDEELVVDGIKLPRVRK